MTTSSLPVVDLVDQLVIRTLLAGVDGKETPPPSITNSFASFTEDYIATVSIVLIKKDQVK